MRFFRKQSRKTAFLFGFITILMVINVFSQEIGDCEKALVRCMLDNIKHLLNFVEFANGVAYCALGYVFCLKYLDK